MITKSHGGDCCGIVHIHDIPPYTPSNVRRLKVKTEEEIDENAHGLVEVVLTTRKSNKWHEAIKKIGYREVSKFINPKTGNICIIYHYFKTPRQ